LEARDEEGEDIVLVMFDCPFYFRFYKNQIGRDELQMQAILDEWKEEEGDAWLESVGPVMKRREQRNMEHYRAKLSV